MAIAQMNWGKMRYPLDDPRMAEFSDALAQIYALAEAHPGFIWRIPDAEATQQLQDLGFDDKTSATVSVWENAETLKDYTFETLHGDFLSRKHEWFETVSGPQLVIWPVTTTSRPSFGEAFDRLNHLKSHGNTPEAYGWPN
ncbi:hypothetical protein ROA7450_00936 [Roseovarius albus]|uniref:DUF3291 domain-containing protein n=1 Tax=Roseovarius albus TaxID=1247867 RepID=A0A1X6YKI4_9RHOB|nr:DUF3291 domain-containing protein [Roseovarius albus]SLN23519.1 hypothetical protein ROA7450_00936 [Roseovarius albus]